MNYSKYIVVSILLITVVALLGCTGTQTVSDNQNTGNPTSQTSKAPTATSSPVTSSLGFARKNPAPIGTPIIYNFEITQHDSKTGKYSYIKAQERATILEVKRGYEAVGSKLTDEGKHSLEYYKTADGYENLEPMLIRFKYELLSIDKDLTDPWSRSEYFTVVATNGTTYDGSRAGGSISLYTWDGPSGLTSFRFSSYEPSTAEGDVLISVYKDDPAPLLRYNAGDYDADMWFKTTY